MITTHGPRTVLLVESVYRPNSYGLSVQGQGQGQVQVGTGPSTGTGTGTGTGVCVCVRKLRTYVTPPHWITA